MTITERRPSPFLNTLIGLRAVPGVGTITRNLIRLFNLMHVPATVTMAEGSAFVHGTGTTVWATTAIGRYATIAHEVTIGTQDAYMDSTVPFGPIVIGDHVVLSPGSRILAPTAGMTIGRGTLVAPNAVLLASTGEWEIWDGIPARKVADREPPPGFEERFPGEGPADR